MGKTAASAAWLFVAWLSSSTSLADPLHSYGSEGAWRHEHSGWLFPKQVGRFARVLAPYTIDGNDDVGAQYQAAGESRLAVVVEIHAIDSAAAEAKLDGAKANAVRKAGDSASVTAEQPFAIDTREGIRGIKVIYAAKSPGTQTTLYFFEMNRWVVKVLGHTATSVDANGKTLDAFVQALPWNTLGDPTALH
jgi:hypothetical protein